MNTEIKAYAKVNLHLEVLNRREDGYHDIFSLMANINLFDLLKLDKVELLNCAKSNIEIEIINAGGKYQSLIDSISTEENIISKAAKYFMKTAGLSGKLFFSLEKNIPAGAGLAGGSADAAAAIKLLSAYFNEYTQKIKNNPAEISHEIGADVPYCLLGGFAICEGSGEIITPVEGDLDYWILIANNDENINTGDAYRSLNRDNRRIVSNTKIEEKKARINKAIKQGSIDKIKDFLMNDFEGPIFSNYPEIRKLKNNIDELGADFTIMSGSGSTIIGLFINKEKAIRAEKSLHGHVKLLQLTRFI